MNKISIVDTVGKGFTKEQETVLIEAFKILMQGLPVECDEFRLTIERYIQPELIDAWTVEYRSSDGKEVSFMAEINAILDETKGFYKAADAMFKDDDRTRRSCNEAFAAIKSLSELSDEKVVELLNGDFGKRLAGEFRRELIVGFFADAFKRKYDKAKIEAAL